MGSGDILVTDHRCVLEADSSPQQVSKTRCAIFRWHKSTVTCLVPRLTSIYSTHHVSRLLNFFVTTLPRSMPRRSTMRWAKSTWEEPEKTLMFGILDWISFTVWSRTGLAALIDCFKQRLMVECVGARTPGPASV